MKNIILIFINCVASINLFSQFYVQINSCYGINTNYIIIEKNKVEDNGIWYKKNCKISPGNGFYSGGSVGFGFKNNFGVEINVNYFSYRQKSTNDNDPSFQAKMLRIIPAFIIKTNYLNKYDELKLFSKIGFIVGSGNIIYDESIEHYTFSKGTIKWKYYGGFAYGVNTSIGLSFEFKPQITIIGSLDVYILSYAPIKGKIINVDYSKPSNNQFFMTVYENEIDYVDNYYKDNSTTINYNKPKQELKVKYPFDSVGFNIGFSYTFNKRESYK